MHRAGGGGAGEGAIPQAHRCPPRSPWTPRAGKAGCATGKNDSGVPVGVWGVPGGCLEPGSSPAPSTRVPPGDPQPAPPQGQALLASLTAAAPLTGVAGSGPGCWTEREPAEGGEQGRPAWLGQQEGAWPCSPDAETASKEVKWELCLWVKGGEGSGPRRGGNRAHSQGGLWGVGGSRGSPRGDPGSPRPASPLPEGPCAGREPRLERGAHPARVRVPPGGVTEVTASPASEPFTPNHSLPRRISRPRGAAPHPTNPNLLAGPEVPPGGTDGGDGAVGGLSSSYLS